MTTLQEEARALGDPTRYEIFRYVADAERPVDVAELTQRLGHNHNSIRQHLAKLVDAALVTEHTAAATGPGRPRLLYQLHPLVESRWGVNGPYERLASLLSEVIRTGDSPVEVGRRAGRRARLGHPRASDPTQQMVDEMARQGFDPDVHRSDDGIDMTLRTCPFAHTALTDPDTVCSLHLGIAYGVAEAIGGLVVDELVPKDPQTARCRLLCHVGHDAHDDSGATHR
ncbi:MAG: helix-turn-helix domain-containing protein [Acidimicrobiales bacterium]